MSGAGIMNKLKFKESKVIKIVCYRGNFDKQ